LKRSAKAARPQQLDLFGHPIEEPKTAPLSEIIPLDFETHAVRMIMIKGQPWWVLSDVARVLGYGSAKDAGRLLRDKHKGRHPVPTLGGEQEMLLVNEAGLYRLMMKSERPEAERFQDWITEEVLPTIRRTGTYTHRQISRVAKQQKRLHCDEETAKVRCDSIDVNKASHSRLASDNASPKDYQEWHNAGYRGQFDGREAKDLRQLLGIKGRETPLDHMDRVVLSANCHAKIIADRMIVESAKDGESVPLSEQPALLEKTARQVASEDLNKLGSDFTYSITDDPKRGKILDVVRRQLTV
jgi:prophage antirepressor-like protein